LLVDHHPSETPRRSLSLHAHGHRRASYEPLSRARLIDTLTAMNTMAPVAYDAAAERRHLALRAEFVLDPDIVYLNHGSFGACPRPVFERYQAWQAELERQPVEFLGRRRGSLLADARAALAEYLGAGHDDVVYVSNVTTALNIVARSLPLQAGDEILTTDHEYGALERTWTFVAEHKGAHIVAAALPV